MSSEDPQPARRHITIRTLAAELGVHPSTVSRALDPKRSREVGAATARRIQALAAERGYEPDPWARSIRTRETKTIGLLIPRLSDPVLASMFEAAEERARDLGYRAVVSSTQDRQDGQRRLVDELLERRVDGLVLATPVLDDPLLPELADRGVGFVLLNRMSPGYPSVRGDDEVGGYLATRHLLGRGHSRVGMVAGPDDVSTALLRRRGYLRAHEELGMSVDEALIQTSMFSYHDGVAAATRLLALPDRPSAIFAFNDSTAIGTMAVARDLGLAVPSDVAVIGYNDSEIASFLPVPLSSVAVPLVAMGRAAIDMLVARLNATSPWSDESDIHPPRLVVRASTASRGH